jgi:hypothetical protein
MSNIYLQIEFGSGNLFQYSKEEKENFEKHTSIKNKVSYRKYYKEGIYGVYRGTSVRVTDFGKELSIHMINKQGQNIFITMPLFDQKKNIATYAESFITVLPSMELNYVYRIFSWAMEKKGTEYKNYGVSVAHADMEARTINADFPLDKLSYSYEKDARLVEGDIPPINWEKDFDGSMKKDATERNKYLYNVLMKYAEEKTFGASNKVTGGEAPKPYTGSFDNGSSAEVDNSENNDAEEEAPKKPAPQKVDEKDIPTNSEEKPEKPSEKEEESVDLPF